MRIKHSIDINVAPDVVYNWLLNLDVNYKAWHPDHGKCYCVKGQGFKVDSVLYSEQYLHGKLHKQKTKVTFVEPNRYIEFQFLGLHSLLVPNGKFVIAPSGTGTVFTEVIEVRFPSLVKLFANKRIQALERHQEEEMINLKKALENS